MTDDFDEFTMYDKVLASISFNLRFEILKRGTILRQAAEEAGLSYVHFNAIINGTRTTTFETLCIICEALGCDIFDVLKPINFN